MRLTTHALLAAGLLAACNQQHGAQQPQDKAVTPALNESYVVVTNTIMRLAPSDDSAVPHPFDGNRMVPNLIGAISRGQLATVRRVLPFWSEVVLQDDAEGWIHTTDMLPASKIIESAVMEDATVYAAPTDQSAPVGAVSTGELVFALEDGDAFTPIWVAGADRGYVRTSALSVTAHDIAMGHLLVHAGLAQQVNDLEEVMETFDRARLRYNNSKLLQQLADMVDFTKMRKVPKSHQSNMDEPPPRPREERL